MLFEDGPLQLHNLVPVWRKLSIAKRAGNKFHESQILEMCACQLEEALMIHNVLYSLPGKEKLAFTLLNELSRFESANNSPNDLRDFIEDLLHLWRNMEQ